jgi:hypothetical protein
MTGPLVVAYGAGTNSTAIITGFKERGIRPDYIVFADTGGEKPQTYQYIEMFSIWLKKNDLPEIIIVKGDTPKQTKDRTLENECLRLWALPSKACGYGTCSAKWKIAPQNKWAKKQRFVDPVKAIGFDFGEPDRADKAQEEKGWDKKFPLIEWFWNRGDCEKSILRAGLPLPGKSSCFFCPSSKKHEILSLSEELIERALEIERRGLSTENGSIYREVKGLGRRFSWASLIDHHRRQLPLFGFEDPPPTECNCYD